MAEYTLTIIDTIGIQNYIFASNRLRENLGASELVERAMRAYLREALPEPHNLSDDDTFLDDSAHQLEQNDTLEAEVLLRGGGNALVLFRNESAARATVRALSERLLCEAPGLQIAAAHVTFDWDRLLGGLHDPQGAPRAGVLDELYQHLALAKQLRPAGAPMIGQGVTLECRSTGLPAVGYAPAQGDDDDGRRPVSADVLARLEPEVLEGSRKRFAAILPPGIDEEYALPYRLDDLGRSEGVQSYIAVVHADGNGIGWRFAELGRQEVPNRELIGKLRTLSDRVNEAGKAALKQTIQEMTAAFANVDQTNHEDPLVLFLAGLPQERVGGNLGRYYLPFRPIVYGGDDVTFVCDGRLGLELATRYLRNFHQATHDIDLPGGPAHACAGVAIVKTHYPFARAYELADQLCKSAKGALRKSDLTNAESAIDWHFALSGLLADLKTIRAREYRSDDGQPLVARPLPIFNRSLTPAWRSWDSFVAVVSELNDPQQWGAQRNKVKELREVLRRGPDAVARFHQAFRLNPLPLIAGAAEADKLARTGWHQGALPQAEGDELLDLCGYFDAIEALDFYLKLS